MKAWKSVCLIVPLLVIGCSGSVPDGWTKAAWNAYADKEYDTVKAVRFIQESEKRRQERDIYLLAEDANAKMLDGHVAAVSVIQNKMDNTERFFPVSGTERFIIEISAMLQRGTDKSFSECLIMMLNHDAEKRKDEIRANADAIKDQESEATKDLNSETIKAPMIERNKVLESELARFQVAIDKIKAIGD